MGTKRQLAPLVNQMAEASSPGVFLDLFSGVCAVATAIAPSRQVWTNDFQYFAQSIATAHFCSTTSPVSRFDATALLSKAYFDHIRGHLAIAAHRVHAEEAALSSLDSGAVNDVYASWMSLPKLDKWRPEHDATLFRDTFAGAYFGLSQSIEIDAIRYAVDKALLEARINKDEHLWLILALCVALSKCTASTGHFAQPLTAKASSITRFAAQRRRSVRDSWLAAIEQLKPIGTVDWRHQNQAFRGEANTCLQQMAAARETRLAVVYADPPYTDDQYSRFYHVYDTLIRYDYPDAVGRGLYRPDREVSAFSLASKVFDSLKILIESCAKLGADLILSYPTNGLLKDSRNIIPQLLKRAYGRACDLTEVEHIHSTMGASKGSGKQSVLEVIYRGYH